MLNLAISASTLTLRQKTVAVAALWLRVKTYSSFLGMKTSEPFLSPFYHFSILNLHPQENSNHRKASYSSNPFSPLGLELRKGSCVKQLITLFTFHENILMECNVCTPPLRHRQGCAICQKSRPFRPFRKDF